MTINAFAGEKYLSQNLPDYDKEWYDILRNLSVLSFFFIIILPLLAKAHYERESGENSIAIRQNELSSENEKFTSKSGNKTKKGGMNTKKRIATRKEIRMKDEPKPMAISQKQNEVPKRVTTDTTPGYFFPACNILFLFSILYIIGGSPNNSTVPRRVFVAPFLNPEECRTIIEMSNTAAKRNAHSMHLQLSNATSSDEDKKEAELFLKEPAGWKKERHISYPTTDLNVVDDFEEEERAYLKSLLDARLSPLVERVYGVSRDSIRAYDMFIVRYDGDAQQALRKHTDSSHISFNVLLNDDFIGGGTRYYNRNEDSHFDVNPKPGQILIHSARIHHEGLATTEGTRYIFVGFMSIDRKNPKTGKPSNLSYRSSWLSLPWLTVTTSEALTKNAMSMNKNKMEKSARGTVSTLSNNKYTNDFLARFFHILQLVTDLVSPHRLTILVNETDHDEYLEALDIDHGKNGKYLEESNWYGGQLIEAGFDGMA